MRIATLFPLLAVLAQSAPVEFMEELGICPDIVVNLSSSKITTKNKFEIKMELENLAVSFATAKIDSTGYYCQEHSSNDTILRALNTLGLKKILSDFR